MDKPIGFEIRKLAPACGAEIIGLDLRETLPEQTIADIREAWNEHVALVFRDQDLSEEDQLRFAARFGDLGNRKTPPAALGRRHQCVQNAIGQEAVVGGLYHVEKADHHALELGQHDREFLDGFAATQSLDVIGIM